MQHISSILDIADQCDAFLCDLWGVIHDGEHLYPDVLETLEALHAAGKLVMFLSNAPRRAEAVLLKMDKMGVKREWYLGALTSGEAARCYLKQEKITGQSTYFYQGLQSDEALLEGLPQQRVEKVEDADFMICGNFDYFFQPYEEIAPRLQKAASCNVPMLCINPDLEVVKIDGTRMLCAGWLAARYEQMGGKVSYIGKPYPLVFEMASTELSAYLLTAQVRGAKRQKERSDGGASPPQEQRIAMIGDNLLTDIKGGKAAGITTILITQGVQNTAEDIVPDYCLSSLRW